MIMVSEAFRYVICSATFFPGIQGVEILIDEAKINL